jgi:hypothetical protein
VRRAGRTLALLTGIAAVTAAPASAATTRAEYAAQANAICAASLPLYEEEGRDLARDAKKAFGKKAFGKKPTKAASRAVKNLFRKLIRGLRAVNEIARNENLQLSTLVAAPGDESLVAAWLAARTEIMRLSDESTDQLRDLLRLLTGRFKLKDIFGLLALAEAGERTAKQLQARVEEANLYGGQLGATTCGGGLATFSAGPPARVTG